MATIKLMCSNSMHGVMDELLPQFQAASGHRVAVTYDPAKSGPEQFKRAIERAGYKAP